MPERFPPDDPREWLSRARSDLILAKAAGVGIYLEDLCFHAQQDYPSLNPSDKVRSSLDLLFSRGTPVLRHPLAKKNTKRL